MAQEIGCILTVYKRSQNLLAQLRAVQKQSIPPSEIIIWHNGTTPPTMLPRLPAGVRCVSSDTNLGVWPRFLLGMELKSEHVCIFDDDTIPGNLWLENCLTHMSKRPGVYGTVGIRFKGRDRNPYERFGWPSANEAPVEVDLVGHSWFFKRDWLRYYALEPRQSGPTCGEDYHMSISVYKHLGLKTYVPPHRPGCKREWGSLNGTTLGKDSVALYRQSGENDKKIKMHKAYLKSGWLPVACRSK